MKTWINKYDICIQWNIIQSLKVLKLSYLPQHVQAIEFILFLLKVCPSRNKVVMSITPKCFTNVIFAFCCFFHYHWKLATNHIVDLINITLLFTSQVSCYVITYSSQQITLEYLAKPQLITYKMQTSGNLFSLVIL